jgi:hypothetical protein
MKKGRFANKAQEILNSNKPTGLKDFLSSESNDSSVQLHGNTEISQSGYLEDNIKQPSIEALSSKPAREEFRCTFELAEKLRQYAFDKRLKKTDVITQALEELFARNGY